MTSKTKIPDTESPLPDRRTSDSGDHQGRPLTRVLLLLGGALVVVVILVVAVTLVRLNQIERVDFDQEAARQALETVSDEELAEIQEVVEEFEAEIIREEAQAEAENQVAAVQDGDLLEGVREQLSDSEINASYLVPYATGTPVADAEHDTFLLLGTDLSEFRADVIILVMLPRDGSEPILTSLPRDLYLPNPCTKRNSRINAALFGCGDIVNGEELISLMVEDFTGVPIDHFATVNFDGFTEVIDAFGGLEICVDNPVRDRKSDLSLPAGCTQADGEVVLQWVRSRSTQELVNGTWRVMEGVDDFARQQRQQDVLIDIANKLVSFSSIAALTDVAAGLAGSVTFDEGMDLPTLVQTAWNLRDVDLSSINRVQTGFRNYVTESGAFVVVPTETFTDAYDLAALDFDIGATS